VIPVEPASWEQAGAQDVLQDGVLEVWRMPADLAARAGDATRLVAEERAHAERMRDSARRRQFVAGHALLNTLRAAHGAPLSTSLSHSGEWIVAAAARRGPVGVDVEIMRADRPLERLSHRFFAPEEHAWLERVPAEDRVQCFYRLWTAKEALFKALGVPAGAAHFAARRIFVPDAAGDVPKDFIVEGCAVGWFFAAPGYLGAYAAPSSVSRVRFLSPA
jgi:phosphopantetheinyl transferase (holo-ACP synthase)